MDVSGAPDATLPVLAKVSSMIEVLQLDGPYELVYQLWSQVTLAASRMNIDVTWSRDEVLVGSFCWRLQYWPRFWMLLVQMYLVCPHGGPHVLAEALASYLGSRYRVKLVVYPTFHLRLMKRCLQRIAASLFGSLDPFSMTEFVINRLKGAGIRSWMASRPAFRRAIITNDLSMPGLVHVVAIIVGVWPLVVSYLKETGRKDDGDSLVVRCSTVGVLFASYTCAHHFFAVLEEGDGRVPVPRSTCSHEIQCVSSSSRNL